MMENAACVWMASNDVAFEMQALIVLAHAQGACGHQHGGVTAAHWHLHLSPISFLVHCAEDSFGSNQVRTGLCDYWGTSQPHRPSVGRLCCADSTSILDLASNHSLPCGSRPCRPGFVMHLHLI